MVVSLAIVSTELLKILFAIGMGQSLILAVILLLPRNGSRLARSGMATFLLVMALMLWDGYTGLLGPQYASWRPAMIYPVALWLIGPSIWLYVHGLTRGSAEALARPWWLHLLPAALVTILHIVLTVGDLRLSPPWGLTLLLGLYAQVTVYILGAVRELLRHRRRIAANLSDLSGQSLNWLNVLVITFLALWLLDCYIVVSDALNHRTTVTSYRLLMLAESGWVILVAFMALRQPDILHRQLLVEPQRKYQNSALSEDASRELCNSLDALMHSEKPYLDNGLTLPQLARRLGVTPHLLSQLLNDSLGCNFYEFINRARVRQAQLMLKDSEYGEMAIVDIAFQSGFNNKNSFNKAFRKFTSLTPSEYRRAQLN
jgi:AraC-like DNA-binding protein